MRPRSNATNRSIVILDVFIKNSIGELKKNIPPLSDVTPSNASRAIRSDYFSIRHSTSTTKIATTAVNSSNMPNKSQKRRRRFFLASPLQLAYPSLIPSHFSTFIGNLSSPPPSPPECPPLLTQCDSSCVLFLGFGRYHTPAYSYHN